MQSDHKVLTNRIKEVPSVIKGNQLAYAKGRQIHEWVLVEKECVEDYGMNKKKGLVVKLDLEKAYGDLTSDFLEFALAKKGFGLRWS